MTDFWTDVFASAFEPTPRLPTIEELYPMTSKIITTHVYPPIPLRDFDWSARFADDDEETCICGWGRTEAEAVADLHAQADMLEEDARQEAFDNGQFGVGA